MMPYHSERRPTMASANKSKKNVNHNQKTSKQSDKSKKKFPDAKGDSKQAMLIELLKRPGGTTIDEMVKATGWQQHSVRGVMSGILKKKLGLSIASEKEERGRIYRIAT